MAGFTCPYCGMVIAINNDTHRTRYPSFERDRGYELTPYGYANDSSTIRLDYYKCPNCEVYTLTAKGEGEGFKEISARIKPNSFAQQYPEYVPQQIRNDYEEACAVLDLSPKSSATLSRRCLQGMIRDYWGIRKNSLFDEVSELKDKVPPDLWSVIDALRQLGNIGAHMEKNTSLLIDIDPDEAMQLINLIEILIKEWYINREGRKSLYEEIIQTNADKQAQRKGDI